MFRAPLLIAMMVSSLFALATPVVAGILGGGETTTLEVSPPNPTEDDLVTLKLSGNWWNTCVPRYPAVSVVGNVIQITTAGAPPNASCPVVCGQAITPWTLPVPVGLLPAGSYEVAMTYTLCGAQESVLVHPSTFAVQPDELVLDHFKCYRVDLEDPRPGEFSGQHKVTLDDQFEQELGATVRRPEMLCNPVSKNGEEIQNPDAHLVCYKTTPPTQQPPFEKREVIVNNQFGQQTLRVKNRDNLICVPSQQVEALQCGGITGQQCASTEVCDLRDATCAVVDLAGVCVPRPEVCTTEVTPVCGCDGVTYPNNCERIKASVTLAHPGRC